MSNPYPPRYRSWCATCGWQMTAYDEHVATGAARVHQQLKPGHHARTEPNT